MAPKARVTASTSALTKLTVTLVRERMARVSGWGAAGAAAAVVLPAGWARNAVGASTPQPVPTQSAAASVLRESRDGFMLIRSKESTALRRACR